uniref:Uncharacterized protein n=1 Tax=Opuntia streptacantha TaxID=393608 RepID=A0A7C8ZX83_OPUST
MWTRAATDRRVLRRRWTTKWRRTRKMRSSHRPLQCLSLGFLPAPTTLIGYLWPLDPSLPPPMALPLWSTFITLLRSSSFSRLSLLMRRTCIVGFLRYVGKP